MGILSVLSGIVSLFQVITGQATISAASVYQTAVMADKVTTENFRGTWTAKIEDDIKGVFITTPAVDSNEIKEKE
jgi:hypothetical protein